MIVWINGTHGVGKPMTVLVEDYWREISAGPGEHRIPVRHFVLHADEVTLRERIQNDTVPGPSDFRFAHLSAYAEAARSWLHDEAQVIDTTGRTASDAAQEIADAMTGV